ncbi:hypothetical protein PFNF54_04077 [Plasmodium falciparum NF54]|uniref:Plasmodium falciparum erythrocyte membrane protein 1 acidic terminal segment domain-containing protein n=1 Tax=Plasmodium falciparum (isolate NF54) TaxID=5843 RepID=W7KBX4_PLAFO|nr:hypothetical protein PFNF54_04077 [Plasmodium falciparum NF54]
MNQLDLLHKWLDRHRDMCEMWNNKEEVLDKLKEQWNKDNDGGDISSDSNKRLNTDVSIEIDMDDPKGKKEFSNMDTILDNIEDDIYYDVNDENPSVNDIPMDHNKVDVPKKVHVEMKILNNTSTGSLEQQFPISDWQTTEIATAIAAAQKAGIDAATQAGMNAVRLKIKEWYVYFSTEKIVDFTSVVKESNFSSASALHESAMNLLNNYCNFNGNLRRGYFCSTIKYGDKTTFPPFAQAGTEAYNATLPTKTAAFETKYIDGVNTAYGGYQTAIIASIVAIVVIVLIMVIIYLILRYRRKKKMKKKLQYIKLLEE